MDPKGDPNLENYPVEISCLAASGLFGIPKNPSTLGVRILGALRRV